MVVKKRKNRKNCIHFQKSMDDIRPILDGRCNAKLSTYFCNGVSCQWYKEKE
jgi:hypothetical protein